MMIFALLLPISLLGLVLALTVLFNFAIAIPLVSAIAIAIVLEMRVTGCVCKWYKPKYCFE